ncbi:hypothetical protein PWT90_10038 [Aphanocladium album]|nr:hypothetical protein PWT90_10038 [Aphanocladium album]
MANTKSDAETPKAGGVKKWDGIAERDLSLAIIMGNSGDTDKVRIDWNKTHSLMISLGYDFTKDAMWYVQILTNNPPKSQDELLKLTMHSFQKPAMEQDHHEGLQRSSQGQHLFCSPFSQEDAGQAQEGRSARPSRRCSGRG